MKEKDTLELILRHACAESPDGKISKEDFLREAAKIHHFSLYTPLEAEILFHHARMDKLGPRLSLADFSKVLDPFWRAHDVPSHSVDETLRSHPILKAFLQSLYGFGLGSVAGAFGAFMVYPIDLVKTRMQNQRNIISKIAPTVSAETAASKIMYKNSLDCFKQVISREGIPGLYSGVFPQLIGVAPEKAIKLTVNDLVRNHFTDKETGKIWGPHEALAGASAGACQVIFTNPLEIVKIRLQMQGRVSRNVEQPQSRLQAQLEGKPVPEGAGVMPQPLAAVTPDPVLNTVSKSPEPRRGAIWIIRRLGFTGLYKGCSACLMRDVPFSAIYFPAYSHLKSDFFGETKTKKLSVLQLLIAGAIAGMPAAYLTTPFDVVKTRLQAAAKEGETSYRNVRHAVRTIWHEEGFRAFWKGGPARILRSSPQFGCTLAAYEVLKTLLPMPAALREIPTEDTYWSTPISNDHNTPFWRALDAHRTPTSGTKHL